MTQYIFVTGGVVSSLGKGIAAASLAAILESRGIRVTLLKLDPYINVDPGTMSPFQHGEVFVTDDGAETDLDLGHYERFIRARMSKRNNFTTGQIYESVIKKDEIKHFIRLGAADADVAIVEIGGTVGDIESLPFLEAIRQMSLQLGRNNTCFIHLTLVPYIPSAGEIKTKPTQHSVKELREIGIQPDIVLCRADRQLPDDERRKIALFTNLEEKSVISAIDVDCIYKIPGILHAQGLDEIVCRKLEITAPPANLAEWDRLVYQLQHPHDEVDIALVGKYVDLTESYKSLSEALTHAGIHTGAKINIHYIDSEKIESQGTDALDGMDAILVPGGFGKRGVEGKIRAIRYAREKRVPYLGICLGMQLAVIEFARDVAGLSGAHSTEFDPATPVPVVALIDEWLDREGRVEVRSEHSDLGGTMRLGSQEASLEPGSLARKVYGEDRIAERHRHRYEVNNKHLPALQAAGLVVSGWSVGAERLTEMIELRDHPWFVACQFHPAITSTPRAGHPLLKAYIEAPIRHKYRGGDCGRAGRAPVGGLTCRSAISASGSTRRCS